MAENIFQDIERTNLDILMLAAGWLRGRPDTMGIAPEAARRADALRRSGASAAAHPDPLGRGLVVDHRHGGHCLHRPARMMKTHRTTYTLVVVFFASLLVLWGLEYYGVRTAKESMLRESLILPELLETPAAGIRKVSIERGNERLVFERQQHGQFRWQMIEPMNVAAEPSRLETLVRNLKELRRSLDAGSMTGPPATFRTGPSRSNRSALGQARTKAEPDARSAGDDRNRQDRQTAALPAPGERGSIEVADAKLLSAVDQPVVEWRERAVVPLATFQIDSVSIKRGTGLIRVNGAATGGSGWSSPIVAPADGPKVESMLAAMASLRVADGAKGFVAE